jgi:hypothetical protein
MHDAAALVKWYAIHRREAPMDAAMKASQSVFEIAIAIQTHTIVLVDTVAAGEQRISANIAPSF